MSKEHITVAILGVDERSKSAYELFFNSIKHIEYELVDDYRQAQLCLLDRDSYKISQQYETLVSNFPEKYILSISIVPQTLSHDRELYLQKPIKRDVMQSLLEKVCRKIASEPVLAGDGGSVGASKTESPDHAPDAKHGGETGREKFSALFRKKAGGLAAPDTAAQSNNVVPIKGARKAATANAGKLLKIENEEYYVGERPDVDASDPQQLKTVFYSPKMLLQEIIETACEKSRESGRIVQLNILNHDFYFDFSEQKVYTNAGPAVIRPLCVIRHEGEVVYSVKHGKFRDELQAIIRQDRKDATAKSLYRRSWSMDAFKWLITLWCSRGRVPAGTDVTQPVYLRQWPNLTRLEAIPHAVRIAALVYEQPRTLFDVASQLGIEQRYVFAFFSACKSIGLSDVSRRDVDRLFVPEKPARSKNQSILSKLLGRLASLPGTPAAKKAVK